MPEKYYISTPIFYPNGAPHIGHAYNVLAADSLARFHRLSGADVFFLSGTDEHGRKMQQTAEKLGITPQALADRNSGVFRAMLEKFAVSNDDFIRTTEARHHKACQALWRKMERAGDIYQGSYAGWYSVAQEAYYDEKDTELGADGARREKEFGSPVIWNEEESYFFRLSRYQDRLLEFYRQNPRFIGPEERRNEIVSFVRSGLRDLSVSRTSFSWGVKVPGNPKHIMYVWVDALANYLTALGYPDEKAAAFSAFWPADAHLIGKDIIRFHAVYWPAFLMSAGIALPRHVFAHGFLLNRGEKMSKSVGNVVDPFALADKFGLDAMRYFFLREIPFGQDGAFDDKAVISRVNADLANDLGNLAQRSLAMIAKSCAGRLPKPAALNAADKALLKQAERALPEMKAAMGKFAPHQALAAVFAVISAANRYFAAQEPWKLRKTDEERFAAALYTTAETVRRAALLLLPFIPDSANKFLDMLAVPAGRRQFKHLTQALKGGTGLPAPQPVFPRLQMEEEGQG